MIVINMVLGWLSALIAAIRMGVSGKVVRQSTSRIRAARTCRDIDAPNSAYVKLISATSPPSDNTQRGGVQRFAVINARMEQMGGGYETDVYRTADHRFVVKHKHTGYGNLKEARAHARSMRAIADLFATYLGAQHTLRSQYIVTTDERGAPQVLVVQPFLRHATPLYEVSYEKLTRDERAQVIVQLRTLIDRARTCYAGTRLLPDLYGVSSTDTADLVRLRAPSRGLLHVWGFFVTRTLLRSHNLLLTDGPERQVVLVDYDLSLHNRHHVVRRVYSAVRALLFHRDVLLLRWNRT